MNPFRWFRRRPAQEAEAVNLLDLPTHLRCTFMFGGTRCHMHRTSHGKYCTFHR